MRRSSGLSEVIAVENLSTTFIPVVIFGDSHRVMVRIQGFLTSDEFHELVRFFRRRGYYFNKSNKIWIRKCYEWEELENEMNELENFLFDLRIPYVNLHPCFTTYCGGNYV